MSDGQKQQPQWKNFEDEVAAAVTDMINANRLMLAPNSAKVYRKRRYFSKDRESYIIFDVAIEAFADGAFEPSFIWLWECKDYPDRRVKVDELEEFSSKMQQVGAHKGTVVTRVGFASGALEFAKSKRIGLATLTKELETVICYDAESDTYTQTVLRVAEGVLSSGKTLPPEGVPWFSVTDLAASELRQAGILK